MATDKSHRLLSTATVMLVLQAGAIIVSFALSVVLARGLGVEEFGVYSYALSVATLLAVPVRLGLPTLVVRETARLKQSGELRQMYRVWSWATLAILVVSAIIVVPVWILSPLILNRTLTEPLLLIVFALVPFMSVGALRAAALRGLGHVIQGQLPEMLFRPALILALVSAILVLGLGIDADLGTIQAKDALLMNLLATALSFFAGLIMLRRVAPAPKTGAESRSLHLDWLRAGMVLGISSSALVVNRNLDMVMLGSLRAPTEAGVYKIAVTLAMLSATVLNVLNIAIQPKIAQLYATRNIDEMQRLVTMVSRLGFGAGCVMVMIFVIFGKWLISTAFGSDFIEAHNSLLILVAGQLANTFFGPVMMVLNMSGQEKFVMYGVLLSTAVNVGLNSIMIPQFGIEGAATATALTLILWNTLLNIFAWRRLGVDCSALGLKRKGAET